MIASFVCRVGQGMCCLFGTSFSHLSVGLSQANCSIGQSSGDSDRRINSRRINAAVIFPLLIAEACFAADSPPDQFVDLSLEQLANLEVTSVSKKVERLADAAASIYVITADAIRRSGAHTLPEVLRLAPNLQVARINANQYAISARGFNSNTANKLLVMIDGRTVYTPLYSGVFWDAQDIVLEDVDRIEVISGPGGTLWGANAVNGVINIITKSATTTTDKLVQVADSNTEKSISARYGSGIGDDGNAAYRFYAKTNKIDHSVAADGSAVPDAWDRSQAGFRTDWNTAGTRMTVQGDVYQNGIDQSGASREHNGGSNLLGRWEKNLPDGASEHVQIYFDHTTRDIPGTFLENLNTIDLDTLYSMAPINGVQWLIGGGYRQSADRVGNSSQIAFLPADTNLRWANIFAQQERALSPVLQLTIGVKLQYNIYSHTDPMGDAKLAWKVSDDTLLWTALSRSVRTPSRLDVDLYSPENPPFFLIGGPNFQSEIADTLDIGLRSQVNREFSYSATIFSSRYNHLRSLDALPNGQFGFGNEINGTVDGLETWMSYQVAPNLSFNGGATFLHERFSGEISDSPPGSDPHLEWRFGSRWNLSETQDWDMTLRHVGALSESTVNAYTSFDMRYAWRITRKVELAITGQNLFNPRHEEYASESTTIAGSAVQINRTIDIALTARY